VREVLAMVKDAAATLADLESETDAALVGAEPLA
jgi:hypothetical protein